MKRTVKLGAAMATAAILAAGVGFAGGLAEPVMEAQVIEEEAAGSRGGILVPILALLLIGLALSNGSSGTVESGA